MLTSASTSKCDHVLCLLLGSWDLWCRLHVRPAEACWDAGDHPHQEGGFPHTDTVLLLCREVPQTQTATPPTSPHLIITSARRLFLLMFICLFVHKITLNFLRCVGKKLFCRLPKFHLGRLQYVFLFSQIRGAANWALGWGIRQRADCGPAGHSRCRGGAVPAGTHQGTSCPFETLARNVRFCTLARRLCCVCLSVRVRCSSRNVCTSS